MRYIHWIVAAYLLVGAGQLLGSALCFDLSNQKQCATAGDSVNESESDISCDTINEDSCEVHEDRNCYTQKDDTGSIWKTDTLVNECRGVTLDCYEVNEDDSKTTELCTGDIPTDVDCRYGDTKCSS